jgi:hypothetical protein
MNYSREPTRSAAGSIGRTPARYIDFEPHRDAAKECGGLDRLRARGRAVATDYGVDAETAPVVYSKQDFLGDHLEAAHSENSAVRILNSLVSPVKGSTTVRFPAQPMHRIMPHEL